MKKIINAYKYYEYFASYHVPEFTSNASEFHVTLWNLNFENDIFEKTTSNEGLLIQRFVKDNVEVVIKEFAKGPLRFAKEFVKASRQIYKYLRIRKSVQRRWQRIWHYLRVRFRNI